MISQPPSQEHNPPFRVLHCDTLDALAEGVNYRLAQGYALAGHPTRNRHGFYYQALFQSPAAPSLPDSSPRFVILRCRSLESLETEAAPFVTEGFTPVGGPAYDNGFLFQAFFKPGLPSDETADNEPRYRVLCSGHLNDLADAVRSFLKEGFTLAGPPTVEPDGLYYQAVFRPSPLPIPQAA